MGRRPQCQARKVPLELGGRPEGAGSRRVGAEDRSPCSEVTPEPQSSSRSSLGPRHRSVRERHADGTLRHSPEPSTVPGTQWPPKRHVSRTPGGRERSVLSEAQESLPPDWHLNSHPGGQGRKSVPGGESSWAEGGGRPHHCPQKTDEGPVAWPGRTTCPSSCSEQWSLSSNSVSPTPLATLPTPNTLASPTPHALLWLESVE